MKIRLTFIAAALLAACGCSSLSREELSPAGITIAELEARRTEATDPHGRFAEARTFVLKQELETKRFLQSPLVQMVETKIMRPGFFKNTTYEDNRPMRAIISNGESSWVVDYEAKKVRMLDAEKLHQAKKFSDINTPGSRLSEIFKDITVQKCRIGDRLFYKVSCRDGGEGKNKEKTVINVYIDADTYQTERITIAGSGGLSYDSSLRGYGLYEGIRIPEETTVRNGDVEQVFKVIYCKLNSPLDISEFRPPVF